jgi:hypothetical protein
MDIARFLWAENVGGIDLLFRAFVGILPALILAWGLFSAWPVKLTLSLIAFWGLFTSITRHCLLYGLLGWSTAKKQ